MRKQTLLSLAATLLMGHSATAQPPGTSQSARETAIQYARLLLGNNPFENNRMIDTAIFHIGSYLCPALPLLSVTSTFSGGAAGRHIEAVYLAALALQMAGQDTAEPTPQIQALSTDIAVQYSITNRYYLPQPSGPLRQAQAKAHMGTLRRTVRRQCSTAPTVAQTQQTQASNVPPVWQQAIIGCQKALK